jgi:hypothetical protein
MPNFKTRKNKRQQGGVSENIAKLLSKNINNNSKSTLNSIKRVMKGYIASPWNAVDKNIMNTSEYGQVLNEYKKINQAVDKKALCQTKINSTNQRYPYQQKLCQSHSGNLFEHSQWSALQILKWFNEKNPVMDGVDLRTAIVAAFFHDIGKGGDCVKTCKDTCWLNMYAAKKYNGKGNAIHPSYSGDMILGSIPFKLSCEQCNHNCEVNIRDTIIEAFPDIPINEVALAAFMHWEFGKLNIPGKSEEEKIAIYLQNFKESCAKCGLTPSENLLKLCIAVACADITAGTNRRLQPNVNGIVPTNEKFIGKDPWVIFGMEAKYLEYREKVLAAFTNPR